jgi:glycosyltransferase involved in cell wall biosynthesis
MRVLIVAHAICPGVGSEPGNGWNWAAHIAAYHDVWVLAHPQYRRQTEEELAKGQHPRLRVQWASVPKPVDPWNPLNGDRHIRLHYLLWQRTVLREAALLHARHRFDLVHHVSWNTISAPPALTQLPVPFIWGPVGGGQTANPAFREYFGSSWARERLRSLRVNCLRLLPGMRRTAKNSSLVIAVNRETYGILRDRGATRMKMYLDCGIESKYLPANPPKRPVRDTFVLQWTGRIEPNKALPLALQAVATVKDLPVRLVVSGDGLRSEAEQLARDLGIEEAVTFTGLLPRPKVMEMLQNADAFLFTSLRDTSGTVVLEAMSQGLPVITLDHQGVGTHLPSEAAIKAPVISPPETVAKLGGAIRFLATNPEACRRMGDAAWAYAGTQTWESRARQMSSWYEDVLRERAVAAQ